MHDPMDWCLPGCACGGRDRATECDKLPGCPNCLEVVGMMGLVIGPLGLVLVRLRPGEDPRVAIARLIEESEERPRWVN